MVYTRAWFKINIIAYGCDVIFTSILKSTGRKFFFIEIVGSSAEVTQLSQDIFHLASYDLGIVKQYNYWH